MTAIVWFRRDLRVHDHPALRAALDADERVVPVFCLDDRLLHGRHASGPRTQFLLECLADLDASLRERGGGLVVRHGPPERELAKLAGEVGANELHFTADISPFARERAERTRTALADAGVELHGHAGLNAIDDVGSPRTQSGKPYTVFTPFHRTWEQQDRRAVLGAPRSLPALPGGLAKGRIPSLGSLGLRPGGRASRRPAASAVRARRLSALSRSATSTVTGRAATRSAKTRRRACRRTCTSAAFRRARSSRASRAARGRRRFAASCAGATFTTTCCCISRATRTRSSSSATAASSRWSRAQRRFAAWCDGQTGFPLVDAGMRQLRREGWMHNRARLVVGSFLTKDLGIDWRWGERHFMRLLVDGDEANNNGNWQWIASVGTDPQPVFRRIYNPARQMETHDPDGAYVRRYVPELAGVPDEYLREPWTMPAEAQREAGCEIGGDYPRPIVDHAQARREALERYRVD